MGALDPPSPPLLDLCFPPPPAVGAVIPHQIVDPHRKEPGAIPFPVKLGPNILTGVDPSCGAIWLGEESGEATLPVHVPQHSAEQVVQVLVPGLPHPLIL